MTNLGLEVICLGMVIEINSSCGELNVEISPLLHQTRSKGRRIEEWILVSSKQLWLLPCVTCFLSQNADFLHQKTFKTMQASFDRQKYSSPNLLSIPGRVASRASFVAESGPCHHHRPGRTRYSCAARYQFSSELHGYWLMRFDFNSEPDRFCFTGPIAMCGLSALNRYHFPRREFPNFVQASG